MILTIRLALDPCIPDLANLHRIKHSPLFIMKFLTERKDITQINKIDKSVANIAIVLEINRQIEEVITAFKFLIKGLQHHLLCVFVRNIPNH